METTPDSQAPVTPVPVEITSKLQTSGLIKFIRIFLLALILIEVGLLFTTNLWVPKVVSVILRFEGSSESYASTAVTSAVLFQGKDTIFVKDANHVYEHSHATSSELLNADPNTFVVLAYEYYPEAGASSYIAKDKNQVYYDNEDNISILKEADSNTFKVLYDLYSKDKNHVYDDSGIVFAADPATFVSLGDLYFKDKDHIYFGSSVLKIGDPSTFTVLASGYAKDKEQVYYNGEVIPRATSSSFVVYMGYGKDSRHIYDGKSVTVYDPTTFVILNNPHYLKDATHVFFSNGIDPEATGFIVGADPATFQALSSGNAAGTYSGGSDGFSKDKNHVYFDLDPLPNADPKTFNVLNARYGKDASRVYCMNKFVPDADPSTFNVFSQNVWFGKDAAHVFTGTTLIDGADPETFSLCDDSVRSCKTSDGTWFNAEDKNHKYAYEKMVQ